MVFLGSVQRAAYALDFTKIYSVSGERKQRGPNDVHSFSGGGGRGKQYMHLCCDPKSYQNRGSISVTD